jgi:hypothetical protein
LKSADAIATASELGAYLRRELPPEPGSDGEESTGRQAGGTQQQQNPKPGTQRQSPTDTERQSLPPGEPELDELSLSDVPLSPLGDQILSERPLSDSEAITVAREKDDEEETQEREGPTRLRPLPEPFDRPYSGTSLVPPLPQANRRAYVAAAVAAFTVAGVGLLILRPWKSQAQSPIIFVAEPPPSPIVHELAPPPPPPPAPEPVPALDIVSRPPGARISIDDHALRGATPLRGHTLYPGPHSITVEKNGFQPRQLSVMLAPGEHRTLEVELRELRAPPKRGRAAPKPSGSLSVRTVPWAKVYEGSRLLGTTPFANVPITAGQHTLKFVNPDLQPMKRTIVVGVGEDVKISLELK